MESNKPMTWEQRHQLLVEREQQRRYGDAHRGLERSGTNTVRNIQANAQFTVFKTLLAIGIPSVDRSVRTINTLYAIP